jgi:rhodanese-related sulfurtransferase
MSSITPHELTQLRERGEKIDLVDVRTPMEFQQVHVDFARNVPLDQLSSSHVAHDHKVYVICRSGSRGRQALERLAAEGVQAVNVEGGTSAWEAAGLPVTRGATKVISLERQVRIAAGLMVVAGVFLGWLVHPGFYALSAFVGAGLVFAGVTDTCGMGLLLARMPWNQVSTTCATDGKTCATA